MSFTAYLSIESDVSKIDQLNQLINNLAEKTSGEVMGTGFNLMTSQRDYSVEFGEQQDTDAFKELVQKESNLEVEFFEPTLEE